MPDGRFCIWVVGRWILSECLQFGGIGQEGNTGFLVEPILACVDLPSQHRSVNLLEHPRLAIAQDDGGIVAEEEVVGSVEPAYEGGIEHHVFTTRILDHGLNSILDRPPVVPVHDATES